MRFSLTSQTSSDGVTEQSFTLGEIPGVLLTPEDATGPRPLILMGHGGGQHKKAPGILAGAHRFVAEGGFAVAAIDAPDHGDRPKDEQFHPARGANCGPAWPPERIRPSSSPPCTTSWPGRPSRTGRRS